MILKNPDLDEGVYFHFSSFSQSFYLHLADGTHVQVVDCRAAAKSGKRENTHLAKTLQHLKLHKITTLSDPVTAPLQTCYKGTPTHSGGLSQPGHLHSGIY